MKSTWPECYLPNTRVKKIEMGLYFKAQRLADMNLSIGSTFQNSIRPTHHQPALIQRPHQS
jgi:hypothetical protein